MPAQMIIPSPMYAGARRPKMCFKLFQSPNAQNMSGDFSEDLLLPDLLGLLQEGELDGMLSDVTVVAAATTSAAGVEGDTLSQISPSLTNNVTTTYTSAANQGWKFMSCSQVKSCVKDLIWLLIG